MEIIGVFHSHTHTDAYPSPTDVAQAPDPDWHYVLVSLRDTHPWCGPTGSRRGGRTRSRWSSSPGRMPTGSSTFVGRSASGRAAPTRRASCLSK